MLYEVIIPKVELDYETSDTEQYGKPKDPQPAVRTTAKRAIVEAESAKAAAVELIRSLGGTNLPVSALVNGAGETVSVDLTA